MAARQFCMGEKHFHAPEDTEGTQGTYSPKPHRREYMETITQPYEQTMYNGIH